MKHGHVAFNVQGIQTGHSSSMSPVFHRSSVITLMTHGSNPIKFDAYKFYLIGVALLLELNTSQRLMVCSQLLIAASWSALAAGMRGIFLAGLGMCWNKTEEKRTT